MSKMTGGQAIIKSVRRHGVDTLFGLPGGQTYHLFDALHEEGDKLRVFNARHEQAVAYMAYGYARSTGKTGVYSVVPGPGVLNSAAALCTAYACNERVLCLAGQIPSPWIDKGVGFLHEIPDQLGLLRHLTKWAERIDKPADAPRLVNRAFQEMSAGRPRPVALEMSPDIMGLEEEVELLPPLPAPVPHQADPELIEQAAALLGKAKNPLIMFGHGCVDAGAALLRVADILQAPCVTMLSGKGVIDDRHYLSQPYVVGHRLWAKADAVLAVGTRLDAPQLEWGLDDDLKIVRIDIDAEQLTRIAAPAVGIAADAGAALDSLAEALSRRSVSRKSRKKELTELKAAIFAELADKVGPQMAILRVLREELPDDGFLVDEITQVGYASWNGFPVHRPRHFISSGYQGNLGYGYATALGVQVANPGKKVAVLGGDGGFMYQATELATAVKYGLNVVNIVFNNHAYGNVRRDQQEKFQGRTLGSALRNPDFARFAESFGAAGFRAETPEQLRTALQAAFKETGPALIEMPSADMPSPWPYIIMPRTRP